MERQKSATLVLRSSELNWVGHWLNEGKRQTLVEDIATEFEFLNQEVKVNLYYPESISSSTGDGPQIDFIVSQVTSKNPKYDIIRIKDYYYKVAEALKDPEWGKKYLVDFSEFPDFVSNHQPFLFSDEYKAQNGGITIGPYNEGFYWAVWFNKEVADKIGIKIKQQGMTPEDFVSYVKATYEYNKKNKTDIIPIFEESNWITLENVMLQLFYSSAIDMNELNKTELDLKKLEKLEKVLEIFEEISNYEPTFKDRSKITWGKTFDFPLQGKCLLYVQGSWMYNIWDNVDSKLLQNMYPAELPCYNGISPCYIGGFKACWAVLKNSPQREQAIKLLKHWAKPEVAEKWVRYTKCPTGIKGNLTTTSIGLDQFEDFEYSISKAYGLHMVNPADNRLIFGMKNKDIRIPSVIDIVEKKKTAAQVMKEIRRQLK